MYTHNDTVGDMHHYVNKLAEISFEILMQDTCDQFVHNQLEKDFEHVETALQNTIDVFESKFLDEATDEDMQIYNIAKNVVHEHCI